MFCASFPDLPEVSSSPEHFRDYNGTNTPDSNSLSQSPNLTQSFLAPGPPRTSPLRVLSHDRLHAAAAAAQDAARDSGCYASTETLQQQQQHANHDDVKRAVRSYSFDQAQIAAQFMAFRASSISYHEGQLVQSVQELTSQQEGSLLQGRDTFVNGGNSNSTGHLPFSIPRSSEASVHSSMQNAKRSSSEHQVHAEKFASEQVPHAASSSLCSISPRMSPLASPQRCRSSPLRNSVHGFAYGAPPGYSATDMDGAIYASTSDMPLSPSLKLRQQHLMRSSPIAIPNTNGSSSMGSPHRHSPLGSPLRVHSPSGSPIRGHSPLSSPLLLRNRSPRNSPPRIMSPLSSPQRRLQQQQAASSYPQDQPPPLPSRLKPNVPERTSSLPRTAVLGSGLLRHSGLRGTARYVNIEDAEKQVPSTNLALPNGDVVGSKSTGSQTPPSSPSLRPKSPMSNYAVNNNNNELTQNGSPTLQPKLPTKRLSRPMSITLESLIVAKLETEHIDLTEPPYTDQVRYFVSCFQVVGSDLHPLLVGSTELATSADFVTILQHFESLHSVVTRSEAN